MKRSRLCKLQPAFIIIDLRPVNDPADQSCNSCKRAEVRNNAAAVEHTKGNTDGRTGTLLLKRDVLFNELELERIGNAVHHDKMPDSAEQRDQQQPYLFGRHAAVFDTDQLKRVLQREQVKDRRDQEKKDHEKKKNKHFAASQPERADEHSIGNKFHLGLVVWFPQTSPNSTIFPWTLF